MDAARTYSRFNGNPKWTNDLYNGKYGGGREDYSAIRSEKYDEFAVDVMTLYIQATDVEKYITGYTKFGNMIYSRVGSESKLSAKDKKNGKSFEKKLVNYIYKCMWVVGTNIVFNYGIDDTIVRWGHQGSKEALFPILAYSINEPSMVERCIPTIDDLEISVRKKRLSFAMLPPGPGFGVDLSLLEDSIDLAGETFTMRDLIGIYFNRGIMFYRSKGEYEHIGQDGSNRPPITPLPSNKLEELRVSMEEVSGLLGMIRELIGINEVASGSVNPQDVLNKVAAQMSQAANSSLYANFIAMRDFFIDVEKVIGLKYKVGVQNGDIKINYIPGSRSTPKIINLDAKALDHEFYFVASSLPTMEDKQNIIAYVSQMKQAGGISDAAYFTVYNMVQEGDVQKAQFFLAIEANKAARLKRSQELENIEAQAQANSRSAMAASEGRMAEVGAKYQGEIALENTRHANKMKEIELENNLKFEQDTAAKQQDLIMEQSKTSTNTV